MNIVGKNLLRREMKERRRLFMVWKNGGSEEEWEAFKEKRREVKSLVRKKKKECRERFEKRIEESFVENSKLFWSVVKGGERRKNAISVKKKDGSKTEGVEEGMKRWKEYFEELMNKDVEGDEDVVRRVKQKKRIFESVVRMEQGGRRELKIEKEEVRRAVGRMKSGKAAGVCGIGVEMLKAGGEEMVDALELLFGVI